jgi:hypothetical protein
VRGERLDAGELQRSRAWSGRCSPEAHSPDLRLFKHFSGFEFSLLPSRVHTRHSAGTPYGGASRTQAVGRLRHLKNMFKSKPIGLVILLAASLVTVITVATIFRWDLLFTGRSSYLEYTEYETQIDWKHSPQAIALELATDCSDYPSKCQLEEVRVFRVASSKAIVVLQERYLVGDSVDASQMRIELLRVGETWEVEWSGMRWRCKPFRGNSPGWTVETCP